MKRALGQIMIVPLTLVAACGPDVSAGTGPDLGHRAVSVGVEATTARASAVGSSPALHASGSYKFHIAADFNGGRFGIAIDNHVTFNARRTADGEVSGTFRYVQTAGGESGIFSGRITCLAVYDIPVLDHFPDVPAMTANRAKWGGIVEESNDPSQPSGRFIWFQSIDKGENAASGTPDVSTLSGFGTETANEAFCASPNVPNSRFGPHAVSHGNINAR